MPPNTNSLEHELLAIRCQLGELAAFDELVDRWHAPLWRYVRRMADRDELAEEILQEAWLRILRGIVKLREPASLVPWLFGIARRVLMDHLRQKYKQLASNEGLDDQAAQTAEIDSRNDIEHLLYEVDKLPLPQRELLTLYLYYLEELTVDEVARVLDIPAGTVKSRLHHVRNLLKRNLLNEES
ncbi:MAG: sigma-70 family RNA polymerase sigma factor [Pirellulales bacterium]